MKKTVLGVLLIAAVLTAGGFVYTRRVAIREAVHRFQEPPLPAEVAFPFPPPVLEAETPVSDQAPESSSSTQVATQELAHEKRLAVPFTPQAPAADWDALHEEACEETSIIMVAGYYAHERGVIPPEEAESRIQDIVRFELEQYGFFESTSATATVQLIERYYPGLKAEALPVTGPESIKRFISAGIPVILPADGKTLPNPHFRNGGPVYHMLVVRGYTSDRFITNDPGTKFGENFLYTYDGLLDSVHDWNNGDVARGTPLMIIIRPRS